MSDPTPEDRRRESSDGPEEDEMRQEVRLEQILIPESTKWAVGVLLFGIAGLITWNLLETIANGKQQRDDKREVWIEIGKLQATDQVTDVRLRALESRADKDERK